MTMTAQEIFTKSATHLLRQGGKSITFAPNKICAYRGNDGMECAIGCLIPDALYNRGMEARIVADMMLFPGIPDLLGEANIDLLEALQLVHDMRGVSDWETELRAVATRFSLEFPEVAK